jgi:signal peptidase II
MPKPDYQRLKWPIFLITVPLVIAADQITKAWIRGYPLGSVIFQEGIFRIVHIQNSGAAFGLFQSQSAALLVIRLLVVAAILVYLVFFTRRFPLFHTTWGWIAIALVFAGASGNLIDKLNSNVSGITDFIYIWKWPAFNVADSAVTVGTILLAICMLFTMEKSRPPAVT